MIGFFENKLRPPASTSNICIRTLFRFYSTKIYQKHTSQIPKPLLNTYDPTMGEENAVRALCLKNTNNTALAKVDLAWIRAAVALRRMVGANCHGSINRFAMEGMLWQFVEGVNEAV
jgi:hypothetical protein